ncbi:21355_t:CDS:2, partial [Entrophospora sp. SA101]
IKKLKYKLITEMEINESLSEESEQLKKNEEKNRGEEAFEIHSIEYAVK